MEVINALGRRKTSVARIYLAPGSGKFDINSKSLEEYFPFEILRTIVKQPLAILEVLENYDFKVNVYGGGIKGQAEAIRLAVSKALVELDEENKPPLRKEGLVTRDSRMVERKKYGRKKARKKFQFSKR